MESYLTAADAKAAEAGVPIGPVVEKTVAVFGTKSKTQVTTEVAYQTLVPGTIPTKPEALMKGLIGGNKTILEIESCEPITSTDGRVTIKKRDTFKGEAYGAVTSVVVDGFTRTYFKHYPVHFLEGDELLETMVNWTTTGKASPAWANGAEICAMEPQFEGLCIKVLADNAGNLRYVTKKKAQLCEEHENLLLSTLVANYRYLNPETDEEAAKVATKAALLTYALQGDILTFRLVHPKLSYINGLVDLSKPMAVLTAINDKHIRADADLPLKGVFVTATYIDLDIDKIRQGAVMAELRDTKKGTISYVKLVTNKMAANLKLLEGVNGNLRRHLANPTVLARIDELRAALHPYHLPELEASLKALQNGPEMVARFIKKNHSQLVDEKDCSGLRKALAKMDTKRAERLFKAAQLYRPKNDKTGDFFTKMKSEMMESHIKLLETVDAKLTHSNAEVAAAAKLIKTHSA